MPYLTKEHREQVHRRGFPLNGAELNYLITYHAGKLYHDRVLSHEGLHYDDLAEILAAMEGAQDEFKRLKMWPYEDAKRERNGEV